MNLGKDTEDVVGVICVDARGRVLLVQGKGGKWSFPKGRRKEKETNYEGAIREAREEAGIELNGRPVNVKLGLRYGTYYLYVFGRCYEDIPLEEPLTLGEVEKVMWVNLKSADFAKEEKNADLRVYMSRK
jgi:8-oxo-dGTP pyrophosphatase MutT (NUDIX family)